VRALLSVSNKTGLAELGRELAGMGWELVASGGTAAALLAVNLAVTPVEEITGVPELLGGRVKTLHPRIHAGILADRSDPAHREELTTQGIGGIDLVVCNLYPFRERPGIETIDIGGPTMVRAAAKNHAHVGVVVDPGDYGWVVGELRRSGRLGEESRRRLARAAFAHTAAYDAAIVAWLDARCTGEALPLTLHLSLERAQDLRYGENPHQRGARYREVGARSWWDGVVQRSGMALSYLNLLDGEAAWVLVHELAAADPAAAELAAAVVVKHANPCGAAVASDLASAYRLAVGGDPVSAFGGIVALSRPVTAAVASAMVEGPQADVVLAPGYEEEAADILARRRRNTRILEAGPPDRPGWEVRQLAGGFLVQVPDQVRLRRDEWEVVTKVAPTRPQWRDLELAWLLAAATSSNAVTLVAAGAAVGIGGGQPNRIDAAAIAVRKAGARAAGAVAASDAFFPFRDGVDVLAGAGVAGVIQPGGSVRDQEVIAAADERGMAMVVTGKRHFRH
jgi:phosphoribosylaminoimidazolecarboxamide formyltransferase/IMP cyclohydrolase